MKIGVYSVGAGAHHEVAKFLLESLKKHMLDVPVFHLTDEETPAFAEPIRKPFQPLSVHRTQFCAELEGDWLYLDTDIVLTRDVRGIFDQDFDLAYAERDEDNDYARSMPVNLGVIFSRTTKFWQDILPAVLQLPPRLQAWEGAQLATGWYVTRSESWFTDRGYKPYKILKLPSEYNHAPENENDTQAAILHYKGKRKRWLGFPIDSIRPTGWIGSGRAIGER